ncbi:MAG: sigma-70 family RNA polymerase sigma factor [Planctomycetota bacterium]
MPWQVPETRPSILLRVRDASDHEAWTAFESIYRPAIVRAACLKGLQRADAEDVAQVVLSGLAERPIGFTTDGDARFRSWLARVTENAVIDRFRKQGREANLIAESAKDASETDFTSCFDLEYRREVFQWAAKILRREFSTDTWAAFWNTAVENRSVDEVASELGRSPGSIYSSRTRIMRRLREQVQHFDESLEGEL